MNHDTNAREIWFLTGSQHLYGPETLKQVEADAETLVASLPGDPEWNLKVVRKPVLTTPEAITRICLEATAAEQCAGVICWMHTFSPAKMWIAGLRRLGKPLCHWHTQFHRDIPWEDIDMDYMNLHQSAHGDREFGYIGARLGLRRKVIVGHWQDADTVGELKSWMRVAVAWHDFTRLKVVRFGDNMRQVAVTEGDKVEAQAQFGFSVNTHGVGDLVEHIAAVEERELRSRCEEYEASYNLVPALRPGGDSHEALREAARIEGGLRSFLAEGGFGAFTDTFEDLHGLKQLPGLPVQRLMAEGFGFGAEGDWKHAALVRLLKSMARGHDAGTSFMEDYTYHLDPARPRILGAHMLEICPSLAAEKPSCEIHPLGIGGKADPVRLVFEGKPGPALNVSLVDLGHRFRLLVSQVEAEACGQQMPRLPVARVLWKVLPDLKTGAAAWILAGGAHHTCFSYAVTRSQLEDLAEIAGLELVVIDGNTDLRRFRQELRWNEAAYGTGGVR